MSRPEYLRARGIADALGVTERTVRRWIAEEILPSRKIGGARLVARTDLEHVLQPPPDLAEEDDDARS